MTEVRHSSQLGVEDSMVGFVGQGTGSLAVYSDCQAVHQTQNCLLTVHFSP